MIEEQRELTWTRFRVAYNNNWPDCGAWRSDVQNELDAYLKEQGINQIFCPVKLADGAAEILYEQAKLNKILSGMMDFYDELPYRPDQGFDIVWRSFEIFLNHHRNVAWKGEDSKVQHLILKSVHDLVMPMRVGNSGVITVLEAFLAEIPRSVLRYAIMRCYIFHDLAINAQLDRVEERAKDTLTKALYNDILAKYGFVANVKPTADVLRRSSMLLQKILKGESVNVNGHQHQLDLANRLVFMMSCVLYTNRCERFHGDYFSPFKSDMAKLDTYAFSYYLLSFCYVFTWLVIYRHSETQGIGEIVKIDEIINAAQAMQGRMKAMVENGRS